MADETTETSQPQETQQQTENPLSQKQETTDDISNEQLHEKLREISLERDKLIGERDQINSEFEKFKTAQQQTETQPTDEAKTEDVSDTDKTQEVQQPSEETVTQKFSEYPVEIQQIILERQLPDTATSEDVDKVQQVCNETGLDPKNAYAMLVGRGMMEESTSVGGDPQDSPVVTEGSAKDPKDMTDQEVEAIVKEQVMSE